MIPKVKKMLKLSKSVKLNKVLNNIYDDLELLGVEEVRRYKKTFKNEIDYNLFSYGNMIICTEDIRQLYNEYKGHEKWNDEKVIEIYKRNIRQVVNECFN